MAASSDSDLSHMEQERMGNFFLSGFLKKGQTCRKPSQRMTKAAGRDKIRPWHVMMGLRTPAPSLRYAGVSWGP
jgi:hypothetical protein